MDNQKVEEKLLEFLSRYSDMNESTLKEIVSSIPVKSFSKGDILLSQGDEPTHCIFVIAGCLRQYRVDEDGNEVTSQFYTEEEWINVFNNDINDKASKYSISCLEDSILVYSESDKSDATIDEYSGLSGMINMMMGEKIGEINESMYTFAAKSPEERVKAFIENRPGLIERVAQHQLASYLGITPESLSRIKKRLANDK